MSQLPPSLIDSTVNRLDKLAYPSSSSTAAQGAAASSAGGRGGAASASGANAIQRLEEAFKQRVKLQAARRLQITGWCAHARVHVRFGRPPRSPASPIVLHADGRMFRMRWIARSLDVRVSLQTDSLSVRPSMSVVHYPQRAARRKRPPDRQEGSRRQR